MNHTRCMVWMSGTLCAFAGAASAATFPSGVASGDVTHDSALVWVQTDGPATLRLLVGDDAFETTVETTADRDFTAAVLVTGLAPATQYAYQFFDDTDGSFSNAARFRTAPTPEAAAPVRFVFSGDSSFRRAPFRVLDFAAEEEADFFLWFGDTIYADVPAGELGTARTLDEYRAKYRQIRSDPALRRLLERTSVIVGWDDHEVANDYDGGDMNAGLPREQVEAAYRAFFEQMPIRDVGVDTDPFRTYRRIRWGRNVEFFLLDGRQYRDVDAEAACGGNLDPYGTLLFGLLRDGACVDVLAQPRTMLGPEQLAWLEASLLESDAPVKFVVSNVPFTFFGPLPYDRWDGYDRERRQILEFIDANRIEGVWILTTDLHVNVFNPDLTSYFRRFRSDYALPNGVVVREVVTGPIATGTFGEVSLGTGGQSLGLDRGFLGPLVLMMLFDGAVNTLVALNDLAAFEPDRFAYTVVEVSDAGVVDVTFRGIDPDADAPGHDAIETLFTTRPSPPPAVCGALGLLPAMLMAATMASWRTGTRRRRFG